MRWGKSPEVLVSSSRKPRTFALRHSSFAAGLLSCCLGGRSGGDRVSRVGGSVSVKVKGRGCGGVEAEIGGEHADEGVRGTRSPGVVHRTQLDVDHLHGAEVPLDSGQFLVGRDHPAGPVRLLHRPFSARRSRRGRLGCDRVLVADDNERSSVISVTKVFSILKRLRTLPSRKAISSRP